MLRAPALCPTPDPSSQDVTRTVEVSNVLAKMYETKQRGVPSCSSIANIGTGLAK